ncbi:CG14109 [Drosophila busckii]|uniref:CG14109 n=1 Tax=Drosophila busckii TaxID=30019 RepID=A0A0M5J412_DROBS|nr:uncharacterized protein LOC108598764 [Drosophila busckii]ALC44461.1 CG14109 [Drosophila busckii]
MVNEINKPMDNSALRGNLEASNQQLQEMQTQRRQLVEEVETLRSEFTRLSTQRQQLMMSSHEEHSVESISSSSSSAQQIAEAVSEPDTPTTTPTAFSETASTADDEESKKEMANYLQEKLKEIEGLKSQFKRVQQMQDTTKMIEEHMSSKEMQSSSTVRQSRQTMSSQTVKASSSTRVESSASTAAEAITGPGTDNTELLNAMLGIVTDFTSDLRGQAESLREERERIKALKDKIIQSKQSK